MRRKKSITKEILFWTFYTGGGLSWLEPQEIHYEQRAELLFRTLGDERVKDK